MYLYLVLGSSQLIKLGLGSIVPRRVGVDGVPKSLCAQVNRSLNNFLPMLTIYQKAQRKR